LGGCGAADVQLANRLSWSYGWGPPHTYHLDGLVARLAALEPEFEEEKQKRGAARQRVETPKGKRKGP